jgi:hypothetical protein
MLPTTMRATLWLAVSGFLLAAAPAYAGPGAAYGHDDAVYPDDIAEAAAPRRVDVTITDRGPEPTEIRVRGPEKLQLVVTRESAHACRSELLIPEYDLRTPVPNGRPVAITLFARGDGQVHLRCPLEDFVGVIDAHP